MQQQEAERIVKKVLTDWIQGRREWAEEVRASTEEMNRNWETHLAAEEEERRWSCVRCGVKECAEGKYWPSGCCSQRCYDQVFVTKQEGDLGYEEEVGRVPCRMCEAMTPVDEFYSYGCCSKECWGAFCDEYEECEAHEEECSRPCYVCGDDTYGSDWVDQGYCSHSCMREDIRQQDSIWG